jgi:hypothetical protein
MEKLAFKGIMLSKRDKGVKYLLETLEEGIDSFSIGIFSIRCYSKRRLLKLCFEDTAAQILKTTRNLKEATEKDSDPFFQSPEAQLEWVYKHSVYYEKAHLQYPIYRVL